MTRYLLPIILGMLAITTARPALAENLSLVQYQDPSILVGTWRSGNFAYQFNADGTYVYVGDRGHSRNAVTTFRAGILFHRKRPTNNI
jgi:hypothetical protein